MAGGYIFFCCAGVWDFWQKYCTYITSGLEGSESKCKSCRFLISFQRKFYFLFALLVVRPGRWQDQPFFICQSAKDADGSPLSTRDALLPFKLYYYVL